MGQTKVKRFPLFVILTRTWYPICSLFPAGKVNIIFCYIQEDQNREIKANPVPVFSNVFKPELPHKGTQIKPFSFEQRDKEVKHKKEEKIKAILEEEKKVIWLI